MDLSPDAIVHALTTLPLDTNPYYWLAELLRANYLPHYSKSATVQIYVAIGIIACNTLLVLFSLFLRIRKKQCWFFRRQLSHTLIQPNLACVGGCLGLVILGLTIFLYLTVVQSSAVHFSNYLGYLSLSLGFTPNVVGTIAIWSLSSSFLIHLHSQDPNRDLGRWKIACNVFGIGAPFIVLAIFLPLDVIAGRRYARTVTIFFEIDTALRTHGDLWSPSPTPNLAGLLEIVPLFNALVAEYARLRPIWQANYIFNSSTTVLLVFALSTISAFYFSSVRRLIERAKRALLEESCRGAELLDEVRRTWIGLVMSMLLFLLIASITFGLSLFSAIRPLILSQSYILASFWSDTLLSVTMSGILLWLSWTLEPDDSTRNDDDAALVVSAKLERATTTTTKNHRTTSNVVSRMRRRSSIWFDDVYEKPEDDHVRAHSIVATGPSGILLQRGREESESTCVGDETASRRLEPVQEGTTTMTTSSSSVTGSESKKDLVDEEEKSADVRAGLSLYRIVK